MYHSWLDTCTTRPKFFHSTASLHHHWTKTINAHIKEWFDSGLQIVNLVVRSFLVYLVLLVVFCRIDSVDGRTATSIEETKSCTFDIFRLTLLLSSYANISVGFRSQSGTWCDASLRELLGFFVAVRGIPPLGVYSSHSDYALGIQEWGILLQLAVFLNSFSFFEVKILVMERDLLNCSCKCNIR